MDLSFTTHLLFKIRLTSYYYKAIRNHQTLPWLAFIPSIQVKVHLDLAVFRVLFNAFGGICTATETPKTPLSGHLSKNNINFNFQLKIRIPQYSIFFQVEVEQIRTCQILDA